MDPVQSRPLASSGVTMTTRPKLSTDLDARTQQTLKTHQILNELSDQLQYPPSKMAHAKMHKSKSFVLHSEKAATTEPSPDEKNLNMRKKKNSFTSYFSKTFFKNPNQETMIELTPTKGRTQQNEEVKFPTRNIFANLQKIQDPHLTFAQNIANEIIKRFEHENSLLTEGIFRVSGEKNSIENLINQLQTSEDRKCTLSLISDPHQLASIMKKLIRDLPDSLIPQEHFFLFMKIFACKDHSKHLEKFAIALKKIPEQNIKLLATLMRFLHGFSKKEGITKMGVSNLALVWGPNVLKIPLTSYDKDISSHTLNINTLTQLFIENANDLFPPTVEKGLHSQNE